MKYFSMTNEQWNLKTSIEKEFLEFCDTFYSYGLDEFLCKFGHNGKWTLVYLPNAPRLAMIFENVPFGICTDFAMEDVFIFVKDVRGEYSEISIFELESSGTSVLDFITKKGREAQE